MNGSIPLQIPAKMWILAHHPHGFPLQNVVSWSLQCLICPQNLCLDIESQVRLTTHSTEHCPL